MSSGSSESPVAESHRPHRVIIFRVVAVLAGRFFVVAVVLVASAPVGDAHLLAEIVRLDRAHHRRIAGDSEIAEHVKIAARAHQNDDLVAGAAGEHTAVAAAGSTTRLPWARSGRPREPRHTGGVHRGTQPRAGPPAVPIAYRNPAAACRSAGWARNSRSSLRSAPTLCCPCWNPAQCRNTP